VVTRRRTTGRLLGAAGLVAALALGGCSSVPDGSAEDLDALRDRVRTAAEADLPTVVDTLGATVDDAWGEFEYGGDGIFDHRRYAVTAVVTGPATGIDDLAAAFEAAGYTVEQRLEQGVRGARDDLEIGAAPGGAETWITVSGPYLEVPDDVPHDDGREPLDLG
jgi:hypothetical protein